MAHESQCSGGQGLKRILRKSNRLTFSMRRTSRSLVFSELPQGCFSLCAPLRLCAVSSSVLGRAGFISRYRHAAATHGPQGAATVLWGQGAL
jgi:hypothetical protein